MKNKILTTIIIAICATSCVQKAFLKTVVVTLTVNNKKNIKTVGIRGNGNPLGWDKDFEIKEVIKDSVYTATVVALTAYKFDEAKFTIDGEWELNEKPNRKISFSESSDTTFYKAIFDKMP